ncbi:MAG TPA: FecR domain-containing protein [Pyrinomonadaceae bacterium]|nr:FecR domain-containing protein [Pyrinomonadaceae bacterium]
MRSKSIGFFAGCLTITLIFISSSFAQKDDALLAAAGDRYIISAKAGHVNFVEGSVAVIRKDGKSGLLLKGDKLEIGDRVSTGVDGRVEILLNPGSFLRLDKLSAFEFETTSLDDLKLRIDSGTAIFEVYAADEFTVSITTPKDEYTLVASGVYRIDISERRETRFETWKGLAIGGDEYLKGGRVATTTADGEAIIAKFDRDEKDAFDIWSKERSKELSRITAGLKKVNLRSGLMGGWGSIWNMFGSFGLWIFDPFYGGYCFLPFGNGWSSPYGYGYNHCVRNYNLPPVVNTPPPSTPTGGGEGLGGKWNRAPQPPYVRVEASEARSRGGSSFDTSNSGSSSSSSSSSGSSPSSPPPSSPPPSAPIRMTEPQSNTRKP